MGKTLTKCNVCGCKAPFDYGRCESCDMATNRKLDRLAEAEALLRQSWYYVDKGHSELAEKIDAFLSGGHKNRQ